LKYSNLCNARYLNVTDGQTDRQSDDVYCGITALCVASRGKKWQTTDEVAGVS